MNEPQPVGFLDVQALLDRSQPQGNYARVWFVVGIFVMVILGSTIASGQGKEAQMVVRAVSALAMIGVMAGLFVYSLYLARAQRSEMLQLEAIEELVTLRRWPQAAILIETLLAQPTRTPQARVQGLIYLAGVLARYHRFDDAITVHNYLLDNVQMDESSAYALRLGRTMAMLREDHLFDADRAISELRRRANRDPEAPDDAPAAPAVAPESAGLALVEIYRDVKTGHPAEALEIFQARLGAMRKQLGHRVSDAWALAAKAHDLLGQTSDAQVAFENATLLAPLGEIVRRYPEVASLAEKYHPAVAPAEAA